jgi:inosine-uridine nucleoside N-ribohydrolase
VGTGIGLGIRPLGRRSRSERLRPKVPPLLWIDTDVALGASRGDVDDGFALAALFCAAAAGRVTLAGISTVHGNTTATEAQACAEKLASAAGLRALVRRGAEHPGGGSPAAGPIAELPEAAEILALGPLTNVAAALRENPDLPGRSRLRVVGGISSPWLWSGPFWPFEFNFTRDQEAARAVLSAPWRELVLYPLDVVARLRADAFRLTRLSRISSLGAYIGEGSRRWLRRARLRHLAGSFPVWDLPAGLEAAGLVRLPKKRGTLRLFGGRRVGNSERLQWVTAAVPEQAWAVFESLLLAHPVPAL